MLVLKRQLYDRKICYFFLKKIYRLLISIMSFIHSKIEERRKKKFIYFFSIFATVENYLNE